MSIVIPIRKQNAVLKKWFRTVIDNYMMFYNEKQPHTPTAKKLFYRKSLSIISDKNDTPKKDIILTFHNNMRIIHISN